MSRDALVKRVLEFVPSYTKREGYPPTYDDIGKACGLRSKSQVKYLLDDMEDAGLITRKANSPRTVRVV